MEGFAKKTKQIMQKLYHNIGLWGKRHFLAENWPKSQEIVILTSTPKAGA
jgi:hypothetical protein